MAVLLWSGTQQSPANAAKEKPKTDTSAPHPIEVDGKCVSCHVDVMEPLWKTPHADIPLLGNKKTGDSWCASCHGDAEAHLEDTYNTAEPIRFGKKSATSAKNKDKACLTCHQDAPHMAGWKGGQHADATVACVDCHNVHKPHAGTKSLHSEELKTCSGCHVNVAHEVKLPSHMPIGEGMECSDCHQPHGNLNEVALKDPFVNQTCTGCHMEYRGPYLHVHPPVEENCMNCHTPHGSAAEPLLKTRLPFLCLECHSQLSLNHGINTTAGGEIDIIGDSDANVYSAANACLNCHSNIHGSNHPAGRRLQR